MSGGALLGVAAVLAGAVLWALGTVRLARANPTERVPRRGNQGWWRYQGAYAAGLFEMVFGTISLMNEVGWWTVVPVVIVSTAPQAAISAGHRRRTGRRTADR